MIVIDASALMEVLLASGVGARVRARLFREGETLHAPHLLDLEIVHVLRRYCMIGQMQPNRAEEALRYMGAFPMARYPHEPYVPRIWQLRHTLTAYDAAYVALPKLSNRRSSRATAAWLQPMDIAQKLS